VPSKGALKVLPKIAVAVPPKRALDITKCLRWEKNKQGELEVLPKRALTSCKIGTFSGGIRNKRTRGASQGSTHGASNAIWCRQREHSRLLPKIAVAVPPKRALDITKCLRWEKNKQGELEVLPKRALTSCKIRIFSGGIRTSGLEVRPKGALTVLPMQSGAVQEITQGYFPR